MAIQRPEEDRRVQNLQDIVTNLEECPADQSDDFLAEVANLAQLIRGLCETERFVRALDVAGSMRQSGWSALDVGKET